MSITSPSALYCGISIQSPTRTISFEVSCTEATSDRIVSLNTSISTAAIAPSPDSSSNARSEEHTSELQSLMRISYAVFCLKKKKTTTTKTQTNVKQYNR